MDRQTSVIAKRFAEKVRRRINAKNIILFGSRARGDNFVASDFDFVIVSEEFSGVRFPARASRVLEWWDRPEGLDVLCYTPAEWERLRNSRGILLNLQREGVWLYPEKESASEKETETRKL